jgi:hypothetical protein
LRGGLRRSGRNKIEEGKGLLSLGREEIRETEVGFQGKGKWEQVGEK